MLGCCLVQCLIPLFVQLSYVWPFGSTKETVAVSGAVSVKPINEFVNPLNPEGLKPYVSEF